MFFAIKIFIPNSGYLLKKINFKFITAINQKHKYYGTSLRNRARKERRQLPGHNLFCQGYGTAYNPSKEALKISQLQVLYQEAQTKLDDAKTQKTAFDNSTNTRRTTFANLRSLSTRIINALAVSGADALAIEDATGINKKIQGAPPKKPTPAPTPPQDAGGGISNSQQSYDRLIDHFTSLIELLNQNKSYAPNEDDLKTGTLQVKLAALKTANTELINAFTANSNALISRNETLYHKQTGLVQISKEVKQYVKKVSSGQAARNTVRSAVWSSKFVRTNIQRPPSFPKRPLADILLPLAVSKLPLATILLAMAVILLPMAGIL